MHICAVKTFAVFAVLVIFGATTVTAVPVATGIVIRIIACVVALPGWLLTGLFNDRDAFVTLWFVFTIQALAL